MTRTHEYRAGPSPEHRPGSAAGRLIRSELTMIPRDPLTFTFVLMFPIVTMLIIGGAFGRSPDDAFGGVDPSQWYVASYFTVVIGATGLVTMPVHIASYRERGVLRRFAVSGFPRWSFAVAQLVIGLVGIGLSCALLLAVAAPVYGVPPVHDWWRVIAGASAGAVAFVSIGVLLGTSLRSARSAQAIGLLMFFPSFLIGVGGPPPSVLGSGLQHISNVMPLALVTDSVREPWLGIGNATGSLLAVLAIAIVALGLALWRARL